MEEGDGPPWLSPVVNVLPQCSQSLLLALDGLDGSELLVGSHNLILNVPCSSSERLVRDNGLCLGVSLWDYISQAQLQLLE